MKKTWEWCGECGNEVQIEKRLEYQECPQCGEKVAPCHFCADTREKSCVNHTSGEPQPCPLEQLTVERVKEVALEHYEEGGDGIIECWTDKDIQDWINGKGEWEEIDSRKKTEKDVYSLFVVQ